MSEVKIAWGLGVDGIMRHISEVKKGKACDCICPSVNCSSPLIANQGSKKAHYFSHKAHTGCSGESALHLAAKQVLEDSASENLHLILPEIHATYSSTDMAGETVEKALVQVSNFQMVKAQQEVKLNNDLIADVVSQSAKDESLAVEIFVTNAKDEVGERKYSSVNVDAIEIDLSVLSWNVDRNELKVFVLKTANRRWLHCRKKNQLEKKLKLLVDNEIIEINRSYLANLYTIAKSLSTNINIPNFTWPSLTVNKELSNSERFIVSREPKVTHFNDDWLPLKYGYKGTAVVEKKVNIDVVLFVVNNLRQVMTHSSPTLLISYDEQMNIDDLQFNLRWKNIDAWREKLEKIANAELIKKEQEIVNRTQKRSAFVQDFKNANETVKMQILCKKLGLRQPEQLSKYVYCWNSSWDVWRTVVWAYKIHGNKGYIIDANDIASDPWLESLLGFSVDYEAYESRRKMVGFWLKKLFELGYLRRVGWTKYEVESSQLKSFLPWAYIR
ncbi:competence protein CoiA family protein [Pseudoalteromonas sp. Angola-18]|uniref:competence protein CoiA family protein n=1 Tax=Pseudoalteromonas sp. Angola-18 TaxID=3025338 RepID=UPI00235A2F42|nr:competence protein CoiA family protein [Pseudoalteromonas sp. Angola-18]MDC9502032.1 competence protein CoiA family protein [Pseudoalteromonas sp. Angola-18]